MINFLSRFPPRRRGFSSLPPVKTAPFVSALYQGFTPHVLPDVCQLSRGSVFTTGVGPVLLGTVFGRYSSRRCAGMEDTPTGGPVLKGDLARIAALLSDE